jgi:uncharacterized protein YjiS (DUF1127 family)
MLCGQCLPSVAIRRMGRRAAAAGRNAGASRMTSLPVREPTTTADNDGLETRTHRHGMHPRPLASVLATFRGWLALRRQRRTLGGLTELDDHLLKDIGLSRREAVRLCAKWFWQR